MTSKTDDLLRNITDKVIARLEAARAGENFGVFESPWDGGNPFPVNMTTGVGYSGINVLNLWMEAADKGWGSNEWCTVNQLLTYAKKNKLVVNWKDQKCTPIVRLVDFFPKGSDTSDENNIVRTMRVFWVLNRAQIQGLPAVQYDNPIELTRKDQMDFLKGTGANIKYGGNRAFFRPSLDFVQLPDIDAFKSEGAFFSVAFHEITHWTGHETRLNRDGIGAENQSDYAFEELIAEIGAALLCATQGIESKLNHAHYIDGYIKALKDDFTLIRKAATQAGKAYEYLINHQPRLQDAA